MSNKASQELTATEIESAITGLEMLSSIMVDQKWPKGSDEYHMTCITLNSYRKIIAKLKAMTEAK